MAITEEERLWEQPEIRELGERYPKLTDRIGIEAFLELLRLLRDLPRDSEFLDALEAEQKRRRPFP